MQPKPKTKADELIEQASKLLLENATADQFLVRRLKQEAQKLQAVDQVGAAQLLGMIATFEKDVEKIDTRYNIALRLLPNNPNIHYNYALSLFRVFRYNEAANNAMKSFEVTRMDKTALDLLINCLGHAGRYTEAYQYLPTAKELKLEKLAYSAENILLAWGTLQEFDFPESAVVDLVETAVQHLYVNGLVPTIAEVGVNVKESLHYTFFLNENPARIKKLQSEIYDIIWEKGLTEILSDRVLPYYLPHENDSENEAESHNKNRQTGLPPIAPLDPKQMQRIANLVEGVKF